MGRILAIDYGERRIGLAVSDETKTISSPLPALTKKKDAKAFEELKQIFTDREIEKVLIGLPLSLSGRDSDQTEKVREFAKAIKQLGNFKIELVDERFTTQTVMQELKKEGLNSKQSREVVDSLVAQKLLEEYLRNSKIKITNQSSKFYS